jgi:predicted ester cyclase
MTTADNKALAYRLFDPNIIRHAVGEKGIESAKKAVMNTFTTLPDKRFVIEDAIAEDDKVALRVTIHGFPTAPGESLPIIMEIFQIRNGRVVEIWGAGTLRQSGS